MRLSLKLCAILLAAISIQAQQPVKQSDTNELTALEGVWNNAHLKGDAEALDKLWAEDLLVTVASMPVMTKAQSLGFLRSGRIKFTRYETSDLRIRVYGDAAVVAGRLQRTRSINSQEVSDDWRFTKVYTRREGKWQVVAWHASPNAQQ